MLAAHLFVFWQFLNRLKAAIFFEASANIAVRVGELSYEVRASDSASSVSEFPEQESEFALTNLEAFGKGEQLVPRMLRDEYDRLVFAKGRIFFRDGLPKNYAEFRKTKPWRLKAMIWCKLALKLFSSPPFLITTIVMITLTVADVFKVVNVELEFLPPVSFY